MFNRLTRFTWRASSEWGVTLLGMRRSPWLSEHYGVASGLISFEMEPPMHYLLLCRKRAVSFGMG
jgi:hypothetical protein